MSDTKFYSAKNHVFYTDNGSTTNIGPGSGQSLNISCTTLTADNLDVAGITATKLEVTADSDDLGLNQLNNFEILNQETSGVYEAEGISCSIMDSGPSVIRLACGGPKVNSGGSSYGGILTYSSTDLVAFTGPVAYQASTFCDDYCGSQVDISEDGTWLTMACSGSANYIRLYKWNGSAYAYSRAFNGFSKAKLSGNYICLTNESSDLSVYFFNGSTWALQQLITSAGISLFDITDSGSKVYYIHDGRLYLWSRSGVTWTQTSGVNLGLAMDSVVNSFSVSGSVLVVQKDNTVITVYESLSPVISFTESYIISNCTNGTYVFYNDGNGITIVSKVLGVWTKSVNRTDLAFIDNMACNSNRLVCGRTIIDTLGRVNVYSINTYENSLVVADTVYAETNYDLEVRSNYKDLNMYGTNVVVGTANTGTISLNSSVNVSGDLSVSGAMGFNTIKVGDGTVSAPSLAFTNDSDTGIYSITDGNIGMAVNGVKQFDLTSSSLTVPKVITSGPFFKLNMYTQTNVQSFLSAVGNAVDFANDVLIENTGLVRSVVTYPGAPNAGSRFTNSSGQTLRILACYSITSNGGTNARVDVHFAVSGYPGVTFGRITRDENGVAFSFGSSAMFTLANGEYFDVSFVCVPALAISTNVSNAATLQVYSLA